MSASCITKLLIRQSALASLDHEGRGIWEEPQVALSRADAGVAGPGAFDLGDFKGELEGYTMAVGIVRLGGMGSHGYSDYMKDW